MRNIDANTITPAVLRRLEACPDARLRAVLGSLVTHLHAFVREVQLTQAEWMEGIRFLTATGQMCDERRQEFILLSDVLGVSMLGVALNEVRSPAATEATVFGPFHVAGAPEVAEGADIGFGAPGEPLFVRARVLAPGGAPVAGATVDVWQADDEGFYDVQRPEAHGGAPHRARGVLKSGADGTLHFRSVLPVAYPVPTDGPVGRLLVATGRHPWRPAHVHFRVQAAGFRTLVTHVFRAGDPYLDSDVVFGVRSSLVGDFAAHAAGTGPHGHEVDGAYHTLAFDFHLARVAEGVPA
jgi:hydroxyquinol 1,2-dioxygenase